MLYESINKIFCSILQTTRQQTSKNEKEKRCTTFVINFELILFFCFYFLWTILYCQWVSSLTLLCILYFIQQAVTGKILKNQKNNFVIETRMKVFDLHQKKKSKRKNIRSFLFKISLKVNEKQKKIMLEFRNQKVRSI